MTFFILVSLTTCATVIGVWAVWRSTMAASARPTAPVLPVSVLKPLCGVDDELESNLESLFIQNHSQFELVFGVQGECDPAIELVDTLRKRYPSVPCTLVVHDGGRGINPKVCNLRAMLQAARYDLVVISDSNVRAPTGYLRDMQSAFAGPGVGLVTSLFRGTGERTLGALMENLHLVGPISAGVALSHRFGRPVVVGKSMMF